MKTRLYYCPTCNDYTLSSPCHRCNNTSNLPHPPKFSPQDHYGAYRRKLKYSQQKI